MGKSKLLKTVSRGTLIRTKDEGWCLFDGSWGNKENINRLLEDFEDEYVEITIKSSDPKEE